jgi:hypothetical protein
MLSKVLSRREQRWIEEEDHEEAPASRWQPGCGPYDEGERWYPGTGATTMIGMIARRSREFSTAARHRQGWLNVVRALGDAFVVEEYGRAVHSEAVRCVAPAQEKA